MASRLPEGGTLSPEVFEHRHRLLQVVLALHVPGLLVFALARGVGPLHALAGSVAVPGACLVLSTWARSRRVRAVLVTAGLLWCSTAQVHGWRCSTVPTPNRAAERPESPLLRMA